MDNGGGIDFRELCLEFALKSAKEEGQNKRDNALGGTLNKKIHEFTNVGGNFMLFSTILHLCHFP
jgi:hypothetical protein